MEIWDIYDSKKQKTGRTMVREDWHMGPDEFHLTVLGVIMRPDGRFLITQRSLDKSWAPGHWEVSGGGVQAGETSQEAVLRELREETGIDVSQAQGGYAFSYKRVNPEEGDNYFVDIYRYICDFSESDVHVQKEEVAGFKLATREEIAELGRQGVFLHYESIKKVFEL